MEWNVHAYKEKNKSLSRIDTDALLKSTVVQFDAVVEILLKRINLSKGDTAFLLLYGGNGTTFSLFVADVLYDWATHVYEFIRIENDGN